MEGKMAQEVKETKTDENEVDGIIVADEVKKSDGEAEVLTDEKAKEAGLSEAEIEMAKSNGLISDKTDKAKDVKTTDIKKPIADKADEKDDRDLSIDEITKIKQAAEVDLDETAEKRLVENYSRNEKAMYFKAKKAIAKKREAERDLAVYKERSQYLEAQLNAYKSIEGKKAQGSSDTANSGGDDDAEINDETVYTGEEVKKILGKLKDKTVSEKRPPANNDVAVNEANNQRVLRVKQALDIQEIEAKQKYSDYDDSIKLAQELIEMLSVASNPNDARRIDAQYALLEMFGGDNSRIIDCKKIADGFIGAIASGGINVYGETASDLAYKLGQMNPKYQSKSEAVVGGQDKNSVENERAQKIIANAQKVKTPAVVGGGRRVVPYSDITPEMVANMSIEEWSKLPQSVKDKLLAG
jgi:hypothetical protein